jgi:hypothetical protein
VLAELLDSGDPAETTCEFCGRVFRVSAEEVRGLLSQPH